MYTLACPKCTHTVDVPSIALSTPVFCQNPACLYGDYAPKWTVTAYPPTPNPSPLLGQIIFRSKQELSALYPTKTQCAAPACEIVHVALMNCEYDYCRTHKIEVDKDTPPSYL